MRILTTAAEINDELIRLIEECSSCQIAVAWASVGFEAFRLLAADPSKIERMVVGTHFYQTHPQFIETFRTHPNVGFVTRTDGVFHPKVYFFERAGELWECLIGSPNFTNSAVSRNDEIAMRVTNEDKQAHDAAAKVKAAIALYWQKARRFSRDDLDEYRKAWERKQPALNDLQKRIDLSISADELLKFAGTLDSKLLSTLASVDKTDKTMFSLAVNQGGIEFVPLSSQNRYAVSRTKLQEFCDEYERLKRSKLTTQYTSMSGVSSYLLTLLDLYERERFGDQSVALCDRVYWLSAENFSGKIGANMKIVSYNQRNGGVGNQHWSHVIEAFDPDIFLAQESFPPEQCGLPKDKEKQAVWGAVSTDKYGTNKWGTAVYAKCGKVTELETGNFRGGLVGIEIEGMAHPGLAGRCLRVFSLHAPTDKGWTFTIGAVNEMLSAIAGIGRSRGDADLIIGGDFNLYSLGERHKSEIKDGKPWETLPEERKILACLQKDFGLINCWQTANPGVPLAQTLRWSNNPIPSFHCDGIFVPASWQPKLFCTVINNEIWTDRRFPRSDHNPVIATFQGDLCSHEK